MFECLVFELSSMQSCVTSGRRQPCTEAVQQICGLIRGGWRGGGGASYSAIQQLR